MEHKHFRNANPSQQLKSTLGLDRVDINNADQVRRFAAELGVTAADIRKAVDVVGSSKPMIKEYLKTYNDTSSLDSNFNW